MAQTGNKSWIDGNLFIINRNKFTYEQLAPYAGNHIAWSTDGTRIIAHHADFEELFAAVLRSGLSSEDVVFSYLPALDEPDSRL
jgi:hypothetical protein